MPKYARYNFNLSLQCLSDQAVKKGILMDLVKLGKEAGLKSFEQVSGFCSSLADTQLFKEEAQLSKLPSSFFARIECI